MNRVILMLGLGLAAGCMAACGQDPVATAPETPVSTPDPYSPPVSQTPASSAVMALVQQAERSYGVLPGFQTELDFYQKQGNQVAKGIYDVDGKPPHRLRISIREGTGQGTKLYWDGGHTVKVRPAGLLGALVVDLDLKDDRIASIRGYAINQTEIGSLLAMLGDPRAQILSAAHTSGTYWIKIRGPHLLPGCKEMTAALDERTLLPSTIDMSDGRETVFRITLKNAKITPHVSFDI